MTLRVLAGHDLEQLPEQPLLDNFHPSVMAFCRDLSGSLLQHPEARQHPELAALGFWLRDGNLRQLQTQFNEAVRGGIRRPLGLVMHFTPANVDTMFIYSWICSLLMGNTNLVRLSSEESAVKSLLLQALNGLFEGSDHADLAQRNVFVSYPRDDEVASELSLQADARVIWGGDDAVQAIRRLPSKPRCRDIPFADRYSVALINGDAITESDLGTLADRLWRDIHPYNQVACSSPRVIFWLGSTERRDDLWRSVEALASQERPEPARSMDHLVTKQTLQALGLSDDVPVRTGPFGVLPVTAISPDVMQGHPGQQLCYLVTIDDVSQLEQLDHRCQTLAYWGMDAAELSQWATSYCPGAIDRIVPLGQALTFSPVWDGVNLLDQLSRLVAVQ